MTKHPANLDGEITFEHAGRTYTCVLDLNAMCVLEEMFSTEMPTIVAKMQIPSATHVRAFVWATLQEHHPEITLHEAGVLSRGPGGLKAVAQLMVALVKTMNPDRKDLEDLGVTPERVNARPPKAPTASASAPRSKSGTGAASTSKPAAPA